MDNELVIRGKRITPDVLWQIKSVVERSWKKGRTAISNAQRRLRQRLKEQEETIPNQINQPTQRPTLKWVFQLFEGINLIKLYFQCGEPEKTYVDNLNDLRIKIIRLLGENVCRKYMVRPSTAYG